MSYYLRTDKGILVAEVDAATAGNMLSGGSGSWIEKSFVDKGRKNVFVFDDNLSYRVSDRWNSLKVFIWEGYYLEKV